MIPYEQWRGQVTDRDVISGQAQAVRQQRKSVRQQQARLLLVPENSDHSAAQRQKYLTELEARQVQAEDPNA